MRVAVMAGEVPVSNNVGSSLICESVALTASLNSRGSHFTLRRRKHYLNALLCSDCNKTAITDPT